MCEKTIIVRRATNLLAGLLLMLLHTPVHAAAAPSSRPAETKPTLFIVGDSTVRNGTRGQQGWGDPLIRLFDPARINVENHAIGGRSSRTFQAEGRWDKILQKAKPGDFVLIQMGHNDGGPINDNFRARGSLPGLGEETQEIDNLLTGKHEVVHTYGWYLRKYIADARAHGMTPIICCGELLDERRRGEADEVVARQVRRALDGMDAETVSGIVIAYEPVWAIGTGEVCEAGEADRICGLIRMVVRDLHGDATAEAIRIQYGGSVKPDNAAELLSKPNIDGALVGGASLKAQDFAAIVHAA